MTVGPACHRRHTRRREGCSAVVVCFTGARCFKSPRNVCWLLTGGGHPPQIARCAAALTKVCWRCWRMAYFFIPGARVCPRASGSRRAMKRHTCAYLCAIARRLKQWHAYRHRPDLMSHVELLGGQQLQLYQKHWLTKHGSMFGGCHLTATEVLLIDFLCCKGETSYWTPADRHQDRHIRAPSAPEDMHAMLAWRKHSSRIDSIARYAGGGCLFFAWEKHGIVGCCATREIKLNDDLRELQPLDL